uniref:Uncharacterized protein n=1 Tax=Arion vulgaris TaxID=1028688 RepID=A0A0B6XU12_9EUPU
MQLIWGIQTCNTFSEIRIIACYAPVTLLFSTTLEDCTKFRQCVCVCLLSITEVLETGETSPT